MSVSPTVRLAWAGAYTIAMCQRAVLESALGASDDRVRDLVKQWGRGMCRRTEIDVSATGLEHVDWSRPVVVMANHQSYLDVLALMCALPRPPGFVAKKSLFAVPFFGGVMRAIGCVGVDRRKHVQAIDAMRGAAAQVKGGMTIAVFPEGTRSSGDRIAPLKKGPFHLASLAGAPTVPVGIRGTAALMPRDNRSLRSGKVEVHVGAPLPAVSEGDRAGRDRLMVAVRSELSRLAAVPSVG